MIDEYNVLFLFPLKNESNEKYVNRFKNMLSKNKNSLDDKWKYFCIDTKEKTIKDIVHPKDPNKKDLIEFSGFNILKNITFDKKITQNGIFSLLSNDEKLLNQNQFLLVYDIIYHFLITLNERNKVPIFLEENMDANLFEEKENQIKTETEIFIDNLKTIFNNRMNELTNQYYMNYDDELSKKIQRVYEILFGKNMKYSPLKNNLNYFKEEYSDLETLKVFVGSWNVACTCPNKDIELDLDSWLIPKNPKIVPDLYFIGMQEVVELNATNVIMISEEKQKQLLDDWDFKINFSIQKVGSYKKLAEMNLIGINFYCYVLENQIDKITNISKKKVKTGLGGTTGNKGSCCINFDYENTSISVACSHLAAGPDKNKQRLKELNYILNLKLETFFNPEEFEKIMKEQFDLTDQSMEEIMPFEDENKLLSAPTITNLNPNINQGEINND